MQNMDVFKNFIADNAAQIWTLVSVIIGGIVTYISTSASETRKNKRQDQKEKLEKILIPYCTCLEQACDRINDVYQEQFDKFSDKDLKEWEEILRKPTEYLQASKRVFLSKAMRQRLLNYNTAITVLWDKLDQECQSCMLKYKNYLTSKLKDFPNVPATMLITFSMDKRADRRMKKAVLEKKPTALLDCLTSINFVINDDPDNYKYTQVTLDDETRNTWGAIKYGVMDISEVDNANEELACLLLEYIEENMSDEREVISQMIDETHCSETLYEINYKLQQMLKELLRNIDKITR